MSKAEEILKKFGAVKVNSVEEVLEYTGVEKKNDDGEIKPHSKE